MPKNTLTVGMCRLPRKTARERSPVTSNTSGPMDSPERAATAAARGVLDPGYGSGCRSLLERCTARAVVTIALYVVFW